MASESSLIDQTVDVHPSSPRAKRPVILLQQIILLNAVVCGLEFCASAAFTYIPPMLLKVGMSEERMSFVLGIGPFLGFMFVPMIGQASDECKSRYGRRRPFILGLSVLLVFSLVIIPYGTTFGAYIFGGGVTGTSAKQFGLLMLIVGAVILDFTSQATLTPCEALLSDACRNTNQQDRCFMVYSFMVSVGGIVGYLITALNWTNTSLGIYLGSQEKCVFSVLIVAFLLCLFMTLAIAQEQPYTGRKQRTNGNDHADTQTSEIVNEKLDKIHQALVKEKDLPEDMIPINNTDLGYDSGSNYSNSDDTSPLIVNNGVISSSVLVGAGKTRHSNSIEKENARNSNNSNTRWLTFERTCKIPFIRLSVPISRLDSFFYFLCNRVYFYLPRSLRTLNEMPSVLKRLALANFFSWTAVMGFNLFYTDFVGQFVYGGNPNAEEDSPLGILYDKGVRMASWGLLLHCITSATYAMFIERLVTRYGYMATYFAGMLTFTIAMALMVFSRGIVLVNFLAACTGIGYATLTTIPFMLVTEYHDCKEVYFYDVRPYGHLPSRGIATNMASLDSAYFLSQVLLSAVMGSIVHMTGTVVAYVICAGSMGAVACACITRVIHSKQQVTAILKTTRAV